MWDSWKTSKNIKNRWSAKSYMRKNYRFYSIMEMALTMVSRGWRRGLKCYIVHIHDQVLSKYILFLIFA